MINQIQNIFYKNGYCLLKKFYPKSRITNVKKKIFNILNDKNNYLPIKNISRYGARSKLLRRSNGKLKINLSENQVSNGLNYIARKTNSISIKEPLIKIKELNKFIFDQKMVSIAKKILGSKNIKLGYIKLGVFFNNKLPKNCINFFHTDDDHKTINENKNVCKFSIPITEPLNNLSEFGIIPIRKDLLNFYKQYFTTDYLKDEFKKNIIYPKVSLGDVILFDPNNFFHVANKPKSSIRVVLYVEFLGPKNKILFQNVKISKSVYRNLSLQNKKLCSFYQKVN